MERVVRNLMVFFVVTVAEALLVLLIGFLFVDAGKLSDSQTKGAVVLSSVYFLFILASIPLTFYIANKKIKQLHSLQDEAEKYQRYQRVAIIRILLLGVGLFAGAVIFTFFIRSQSIGLCLGISALSMFFCLPSQAKMLTELTPKKEKKEDDVEE